MFDSALRLCNCCFVASSVLAISIASSSDSVSSLWISFDCTCSELVPNMRVPTEFNRHNTRPISDVNNDVNV